MSEIQKIIEEEVARLKESLAPRLPSSPFYVGPEIKPKMELGPGIEDQYNEVMKQYAKVREQQAAEEESKRNALLEEKARLAEARKSRMTEDEKADNLLNSIFGRTPDPVSELDSKPDVEVKNPVETLTITVGPGSHVTVSGDVNILRIETGNDCGISIDGDVGGASIRQEEGCHVTMFRPPSDVAIEQGPDSSTSTPSK